MHKIKLNIFEPTLVDVISVCNNIHPEDLKERESRLWENYDSEAYAIQTYSLEGYKWCVFNQDNFPMIIGGLHHSEPGCASTFMFSDKRARKRDWAQFDIFIKKLLPKVFTETDIQRIEILTLAEKTKAHDWFLKLGFAKRCLLEKKGKHGEDFYMFDMVRQ
jgi:hypothetical protein